MVIVVGSDAILPDFQSKVNRNPAKNPPKDFPLPSEVLDIVLPAGFYLRSQ